MTRLETKKPFSIENGFFSRGARIRTADLFDPNEARCQAAPHPEQAQIINDAV